MRLRAVLAHELSHVRRRDPLTQLVAELARAVHWYNPLAWYAAGRLMTERERACDDEVVRMGMRAIDYADHLLALARLTVRPHVRPRGALAMTAAMGLEARVTALLEPVTRRGRVTRMQRGLIGAHAVVVLFALGLMGGTRSHAGGGAMTALGSSPPKRAMSFRAAVPMAAAQPGERQSASPTAQRNETTEDIAPAAAEGESREPATMLVPSAASLDDPRSERVELARPWDRWPSEREIEAAPERDAIMRLRAAADHRKTSEFDLVRERAQWALTRVERGRIAAPLERSLEDPDWRIRAYAAWSLAVIDARGAVPSIQQLLDDPTWRVRAHAAASLLELRATPSSEVLERLATDSAWQVRICAVEFFQRRNDREARAALERMRMDPHTGTRMQVEAALSR